MTDNTMNTRLTLEYTCASAKKTIEVIVPGAISQQQVDGIQYNAIDGHQIIADQVGLPSPLELMIKTGEIGGYDENDHPLTNLADWNDGAPRAESLHTREPVTPGIDASIEELTERLVSVAWDQGEEMDRLGLPDFDLDDEDSPLFS